MKGNIDISMWKTVASYWRSLGSSVEKLIVIEEQTKKAINELHQMGGIVRGFDYLESPFTDDEDIP